MPWSAMADAVMKTPHETLKIIFISSCVCDAYRSRIVICDLRTAHVKQRDPKDRRWMEECTTNTRRRDILQFLNDSAIEADTILGHLRLKWLNSAERKTFHGKQDSVGIISSGVGSPISVDTLSDEMV